MPDVESLVVCGRVHAENNEPFHAELFYRQVLKTTFPPKTPIERLARGEACMFLAKMALARDRIGEAGDWYKLAMEADPAASDYRAEFVSKVLLPLGMLKAAREEAERATKIDPESAKAWLALGEVTYETCDVDTSRYAREKALSLRPGDSYLMLEVARLELDVANYGAVRDICGVLSETGERPGDVLHFLAMVAYREGRHAESVELYTRAIEMGCSDVASAKFNRALPAHAIGNYKDGWADYEARGETNGIHSVPFKRFNVPIWRGEPAPARLHLHEEMGYGDTLALARYAPILAARGYDVRMEVRPELVELFTYSMPGVRIVPKAVDYPGVLGIAPFDYHVPMLSLPHIMGTTVDTVPWDGPYLKANPSTVYKYAFPPGKKVGLVWSSGIRDGLWLKEYGRRKSMRLQQMGSILDANGIKFISLQLGPESAEGNGITIDPIGNGINGICWADTAAVVEHLDLVITVDTAVSHLVGAMGKPVWVMVADHAASWHWMTKREDSPWYPSAKLYRQTKPGVWDDVVERVAADLRAL